MSVSHFVTAPFWVSFYDVRQFFILCMSAKLYGSPVPGRKEIGLLNECIR